MRIALLTYSTRPRGGVVHTLALAEALARAGATVTVFAVGRDGDAAFFRPVDPAVRVRVVDFPAVDGEAVGARIVRSIATLRAAFDAHLAAGGTHEVPFADGDVPAAPGAPVTGFELVFTGSLIQANAIANAVFSIDTTENATGGTPSVTLTNTVVSTVTARYRG